MHGLPNLNNDRCLYTLMNTATTYQENRILASFYFFIFCKNYQNKTISTYRVSQEECARLREGVPYVKVYLYNPKHLYPKLNGYGDNGQRSLKL